MRDAEVVSKLIASVKMAATRASITVSEETIDGAVFAASNAAAALEASGVSVPEPGACPLNSVLREQYGHGPGQQAGGGGASRGPSPLGERRSGRGNSALWTASLREEATRHKSQHQANLEQLMDAQNAWTSSLRAEVDLRKSAYEESMGELQRAHEGHTADLAALWTTSVRKEAVNANGKSAHQTAIEALESQLSEASVNSGDHLDGTASKGTGHGWFGIGGPPAPAPPTMSKSTPLPAAQSNGKQKAPPAALIDELFPQTAKAPTSAPIAASTTVSHSVARTSPRREETSPLTFVSGDGHAHIGDLGEPSLTVASTAMELPKWMGGYASGNGSFKKDKPAAGKGAPRQEKPMRKSLLGFLEA